VVIFSDAAANVGARSTLDEGVTLTSQMICVVFYHWTGWDIQDARVGLSGVDFIDRVDGVAVPGHVIARINRRHVDHSLSQVEMGAKKMRELLASAWRGAVDPRGGRGVNLQLSETRKSAELETASDVVWAPRSTLRLGETKGRSR
jgi:hypothetical protein